MSAADMFRPTKHVCCGHVSVTSNYCSTHLSYRDATLFLSDSVFFYSALLASTHFVCPGNVIVVYLLSVRYCVYRCVSTCVLCPDVYGDCFDCSHHMIFDFFKVCFVSLMLFCVFQYLLLLPDAFLFCLRIM